MVLAGVAAAAGQAPLGWWFLALAGYAGACLAVARAGSPRAAAAAGFWFGAGHFAAALSWIVEPFLIDAARHAWMAPFALAAMAAGTAAFWAGAAWAAARWLRPAAAGFAVALSAAEMARGHLLTGFPWALPGHVWIATPVGQSAALWGGYGLTLLTLLLAALPVAAGWRGLALAAAAGGGLWAWGAARLAAPGPAPLPAVVRLVQPAAEQAAKWDPGLARAHFARLIALTASPAAVAPALVVWPETSLPYLFDGTSRMTAEIAAAAGGAAVAVGAQRGAPGGAQAWNSLVLVGPGGEARAAYDKHHLVPFGEYIPLGDLARDWLGLRAFAAVEGYGYSAGPGPAVVDAGPGLGRAVPLICYEAVFPAIPRQAQAAGGRAGWMVQITNDAWFGTWTGPYQHLALARLRAIEQGLPLLRAANTGVSAAIDARGRVLAMLPLGAQGVLDVPLPGALPPPPYARTGDTPLALLLGIVGLAMALAARRKRT